MFLLGFDFVSRMEISLRQCYVIICIHVVVDKFSAIRFNVGTSVVEYVQKT